MKTVLTSLSIPDSAYFDSIMFLSMEISGSEIEPKRTLES